MARAQTFHIDDVNASRIAARELYREFLRVPELSVGLYVLPASAQDPQSPHAEDEIYLILQGKAKVRLGSKDHDVRAGDVVYVPAKAGHRFHDIREELVAVVVFAPAEGSRG